MYHRTLVEPETLYRRLGAPGWAIFDCRFDLAETGRGLGEYHQSHIPGARYAHLDHDLSGPITGTTGRHPLPDPGVLCRWLGDNGVGPDTQVVAYDDSFGTMAVRLWWLLRWLGHRRVAVLDGGWQAWQAARFASSPELPESQGQAPYPGRPRPDMLVTTEQVLADLGRGDWLLLDARTPERFSGELEPIDPVAGHIPGARSLPLQRNLDSEGRFLPAQRLHALYRKVLDGWPPERTACLCGSGVTACHNLLALEIAGLPGARLYAGSWSEWIRDPARPVTTGPA
jgi:thiosulfate/3-mercaptopyruvate sulfurtransferase